MPLRKRLVSGSHQNDWRMNSLQKTDVGIGFRPAYFNDLLTGSNTINCLEIMTDDYIGVGGSALAQLEALSDKFPLVFHGVSLSLAGTDPLDLAYLKQVKELAKRFSAVHVSEHLCWTGVDGRYSFDLLPFPWNEATLAHVADRVNRVQDVLGQQLVLENLSQYVSFKNSTLIELEFWIRLIQCTGCGMLLDVNNVYVNSHNFGYSAENFLDTIPVESIKQIHLAGHRMQNGLCIDTHDAAVATSVYDLYRRVWERAQAPTILERDDELPALVELEDELKAVKSCQERLEWG